MKKSFLKNIIKESITDYLSELNTTNHLEEELIDEDGYMGTGYDSSEDMAVDMMKNGLREDVETELENNISKDGNIYLVRKPNKDTAEGGIVEEKSISELIGADYIGAFTSKEKATAFGKKALKQRDSDLKENVKKGQTKVSDLETQIATLKTDMQKLIDNPDTRSELSSYTARLEKFEALLDKLKTALESNSSKKEKKETKDELKEFSPHGSIAFSGEKEKEKEKAPLSSLKVGDLIYIQGISGNNIVVKSKKEDGTVGVGSPHNDKISYLDGNKEVEVVRRAYRK